MRVREPRGGLGLTGEPLANVLLEGELGRKHLDRHAALEALVAGPVHYAHAAATDLALDRVRISKGFGETGGERPVGGHGKQSVPAHPGRQPNGEKSSLTQTLIWGQFGRAGEPRATPSGSVSVITPKSECPTYPLVAWSVQTVPAFPAGLSFRPVVGLCKEYPEWPND